MLIPIHQAAQWYIPEDWFTAVVKSRLWCYFHLVHTEKLQIHAEYLGWIWIIIFHYMTCGLVDSLGFVPCSSKTLISPYRTIQHQFLVPQSGCVVKLRGSELVLCGLWNKLCRDASANFLICCCNVGYPGIYRAHVIYEDVLWFVIRWWLELLHHFEVTGLCLKHIMATKIIILEITMNTKDFSAPVLPTQGVLNSHKCFRGTVLHIYTCHCGSWFCFCLQSALWI